jgi:hypothetical protein
MLYSSWCESRQRDAKDAFFMSGLNRDFGIASSLFGSTQPISLTAVGQVSGNSLPVYLNSPGVWYLRVATATEQGIYWSSTQTVIVGPWPSVATTPPAAPRPPAQAATQPAAAPQNCQRYVRLWRVNSQQLKRARAAPRAAEARSARRAAKAKIMRLGRARIRISTSRAKCLRG